MPTPYFSERFKALNARLPLFARNVAVLASGTILGQAIMVAILPVLTRLYDPATMGLLAVYASTAMLLSFAACLRLELAIPLPEHDGEAVNLLILALAFGAAISLALGLLVLIAPQLCLAWLAQPAMAPYLWMIPVGVFFATTYSALQFWSIRKGRYGDIARTQLVRAGAGAASQVGLGIAGAGATGLLVGNLLYTGLGSGALGRLFWSHDRKLLGEVNRQTLLQGLSRYRRFPLLSTPEAILDAVANNLPLLLIAGAAGPAEAAFLMLAQRVSSIPIGLIGASVSRVFLAEGAERMRAGTLGPFTRKLIRHLAIIGSGPFLAMAVLAPFLAVLAFGNEWHRTGVMLAALAPSMFLQFLSSPVSTILAVTQKQHISLMLQGFGVLCTTGAIIAARSIDPASVFYAYAAGNVVYYLAYLGAVLFVARRY